jgi:hypothetical protein
MKPTQNKPSIVFCHGPVKCLGSETRLGEALRRSDDRSSHPLAGGNNAISVRLARHMAL